MGLLLRWLIATVAILISAYLVPGVEVSGIWPAVNRMSPSVVA
mgnify:CR=1 FL=1